MDDGTSDELDQRYFLMILSLTFEILVPNSEMEKYLKLIFSLIILLMILDPVIRYISD